MTCEEILYSLNAKILFPSNFVSAKNKVTSKLPEAEPNVLELDGSKTSWLIFYQW